MSSAPQWRHTYVGHCAKHNAPQVAVRYSTNGVGPDLPIEERLPGEFCFQCYCEAKEPCS